MLNQSFAADPPAARATPALRGVDLGRAVPAAAAPHVAEAGGADRYRDATRAVGELRRGAAVIVVDGAAALACAAAETVDAARLDDLLDWSGSPPLLLRPATPAAHQGPAIAAIRLPPGALTLLALRRLADPSQPNPSQPNPSQPDPSQPDPSQPNPSQPNLSLADPSLADPSLADPSLAAAGRSDNAPPAAAPGACVSANVVPPCAPAAIVLAKLAHLLPTLVAAPVAPDSVARARADGAIVVAAADILALRAAARRLVRVGEAAVPLQDAAAARVVAFRNPESGVEHIAVVIGAPERAGPSDPAPLVRLHSECFTGDVLGSLRCDCGPQLRAAMRRMAEEGAGIVLYLAQEGRGIGLLNKLRSYVLQDRGLDTLDANAALGWEADERDFSLAAAMLRDLGLSRVRLMTNNPAKLAGLAAGGLAVERASLLIAPNGVNDGYLATKAARFGHLLG